MKKEVLLKRFKAFIKSICKNDVVAIVHHRDTDGLCAALVFSKALQKIRGRGADFAISAEYFEFGEAIAALKSIAPDKIVSLDLSIDQSPEDVKSLEKLAPLLLIDHHKQYRDCNSKRTVFIKAQHMKKIDGSKYPASKLAFDLCSNLVSLKKEQWIACVGLLGDMSYKNWKPFFAKTIKENKVSLKQLQSLEGLVSAVETIQGEKFADLFAEFHSKTPKQLLKSPLNKYKKMLSKELSKWQKDFKKNAEFHKAEGLIFYKFKPPFEIKSALIDSLTLKHPDKTLIIVQDLGEKNLRFSARRQDFKVKMNELLENATKGIPGASGGGHIPASAGAVPRAKFPVFKENVVRILSKGKK
ncbi:MAG: DHH family phosphoesterase [Candidatus Diapherotrites archaeon]|nr:DHH family phosphoesterase [Candidatus Diapherotrites archaeon]